MAKAKPKAKAGKAPRKLKIFSEPQNELLKEFKQFHTVRVRIGVSEITGVVINFTKDGVVLRENGQQKPYEMNIALYDAFKGTIRGKDNLQRERFLASQTIMMALGGVPAFYIHSLLATPNDYDRFKRGNYKRGINRHKWKMDLLNDKLKDPESDQSCIFNELKRLIKIRAAQKCFHPNATQFTLHLPCGFFGVWRQSLDRKQNTFCITNLTDKNLALPLHTLNMYSGVEWVDLLTEQSYKDHDQEVTFSPYQSMWITGRRS